MKKEELSSGQMDYLQSEFDRQRDMILHLAERESLASKRLEETRNSFSYKLGRLATYPVRKLLSLVNRTIYRDEREFEQNLENDRVFPGILVSPEFIPDTKSSSFENMMVHELLIWMAEERPSSNEIRDYFKRKNKSIHIDNIKETIIAFTKYSISNFGYKSHRKSFFVGSLRFLSLTDPARAVDYYDQFGSDIEDERAKKEMVNLLIKMGEMKRPYEIISQMGNNPWTREVVPKLKNRIKLLENGFSNEVYQARQLNPVPGNILYCASQTLPYTSNGYAIRTHEIVKSVSRLNRNITVCARHGYPLDRVDFTGEFDLFEEKIDGITYNFNISNSESQS